MPRPTLTSAVSAGRRMRRPYEGSRSGVARMEPNDMRGTPLRIAPVQSGPRLRLLPLDPGGDHRLRPQVEVGGNARRELVGRIAERIGTQARKARDGCWILGGAGDFGSEPADD